MWYLHHGITKFTGAFQFSIESVSKMIMYSCGLWIDIQGPVLRVCKSIGYVTRFVYNNCHCTSAI